MVYISKCSVIFVAISCMATSAYADINHVDSTCNPVVKLDASDTTLANALQHLAENYQFELSFPKNLDKPVHIDDAMPLDQMIKFLTRDMNTALQHKKITGCKTSKLTQLTIMPSGEATEFVNVIPQQSKQLVEYIYIDDMDLYAEEVLLKQRKANKKHMTREQRLAFMESRKRVKKQLIEAGILGRKQKNGKRLTKEERREKRKDERKKKRQEKRQLEKDRLIENK